MNHHHHTSPFQQIVLASNNSGKLREFEQLFHNLNIQLIPQSQFHTPECPEPHITFLENALAKARHASQFSQLPALADDSGICVPALNGQPGVLSARFAGDNPKSDSANNQKLTQLLQNHPQAACYYVCVLALVRHPNDPQPLIAQGIWHGTWQPEPQGEHGFGYDPHFYLPSQHATAAQIPPEIKNQISHRAIALQNLIQQIKLFQ